MSHVCFMLTEYHNSDQPLFKGSRATCGHWLPYWAEQFSRPKIAEIISFLGCHHDGHTGSIDPPTQSGQVPRWGPGSILNGRTNPISGFVCVFTA